MTSSTTLPPLHIEPRPEFARILRDEPFATSDDDSDGAQPSDSTHLINRAFDRLIVQSATRLSGAVVLRLCLLFALTCGGSAFVFLGNLLVTALATGVGALLPVALLALRRSRRRTKLAEQFPALVEQILRAVRAGRGLDQSLEQISAHTAAPLGEELQVALRRRELGLTLGEALSELGERTGLSGAHVLVSAIRLSERHGGDLTDCLQHLAHTQQASAQRSRQLRETTAAEWATGVLVFLLQALVVWLFIVADPQQISRLSASRASLGLIAAAGAILIAGWYCVLRLSAARRST
ncbi:MAG TPA: type II secretion system F family protein [Planctomycetaceae bacterium]|jgi:tight adherence protein B|nr:type II secretion system F family protein [Planctomycetaceae bacterium]